VKDFSRRTFLIALFVFIASLVSAQPENLNDLSLNQLKKFGKSAARAGDVNTAIYFYEKYHDSRKNNQDVNYTLAELQAGL
jgi:hypothetical protein